MTGFLQHRNIFLLLFLFTAGSSFAQQATTIKATVDKDKIIIGEQFVLTIEASIPENEPIRFINFDSIPHFEFIGNPKNDTINKGGNTIIRRQIQTTSFDSGQWVIPPYVMSDGIQSDSIIIDVSFSEFDSTQPYHDVKQVEDVEEEKEQDKTWWIAVGATLLFLIVIIYLLSKKKKTAAPVANKPLLSPFETAMQAFQQLQTNQTDNKVFHTGLSNILRDYLDSRLALNTNQQTTNQLLQTISAYLLPETTFNNVKQSLLLGDFVKFAKFTPQASENEFSVEAITTTIQQIEAMQKQQETMASSNKTPNS